MKCTIDIPYPKIRVVHNDPLIVIFLMHIYAWDISEETAIHQYVYQSIFLQKDKKEISQILSEIAKVEMYHLQILGLLIKELGVYPMFLDPVVDKYEFWTSKYVCYDENLKKMIQANIRAEKKAIANYNSLIYVIEDIYVQEILKRIVLDERLHLEIFEKILLSL